MDELGWRVVLLGAGLILALAWFASALRRAPKRRSRWQRLRDELRPDGFQRFLSGRGDTPQGDSPNPGEPRGVDFGERDSRGRGGPE